MQSLKELLKNKQDNLNQGNLNTSTINSINRVKIKPVEEATIGMDIKLRYKYWNDKLFEIIPDLVNKQFRSWYCSVFHKIGKKRALILISIARVEGKDPVRYFSYLLKKEVK